MIVHLHPTLQPGGSETVTQSQGGWDWVVRSMTCGSPAPFTGATVDRPSAASKSVSEARIRLAAVGSEAVFHCRMSLLPDTTERVSAFVITFCGVTRQIDRSLLKTRTEDLRQSLADLQATAETVMNFADMDQVQPAMRFSERSLRRSQRLQQITLEQHHLYANSWPMNDVYSPDLIGRVFPRSDRTCIPQI